MNTININEKNRVFMIKSIFKKKDFHAVFYIPICNSNNYLTE